MIQHWHIDHLPWDRFDPGKIDPEITKLVKAASLVEANGQDYADYLCNVFSDDPEFQAAARYWAVEEVQHGEALGRWAEHADPNFRFQDALGRFREGYRIPAGQGRSVRGSRAGELVARCIVETGTSSYYTALMEAAEEPVLKEICRNIAADEYRHYKLFYTHLKRYLKKDKIGRLRRSLIALGRITESEDDELAYAYYAANGGTSSYDRKTFARAYAGRAYSYYRRHHIDRGIAMVLKAAGLPPAGRLHALLSHLAFGFMQRRQNPLQKQAA